VKIIYEIVVDAHKSKYEEVLRYKLNTRKVDEERCRYEKEKEIVWGCP
jgi:hypothetical protein